MHPAVTSVNGYIDMLKTWAEAHGNYKWLKNSDWDYLIGGPDPSWGHYRSRPNKVLDIKPEMVPCTIFVDEYDEVQAPNRNGIYFVTAPMSIYHQLPPLNGKNGFLDIINHLKDGTIVKMTPGESPNINGGFPMPVSDFIPPIGPLGPDGSQQTLCFNMDFDATQGYHPSASYKIYALGDTVIHWVADDPSDPNTGFHADYSQYHVSLYDNSIQKDFSERWDIKTSLSQVKGLYADMIGPKTYIVEEAPFEKFLWDVTNKCFIESVHVERLSQPSVMGDGAWTKVLFHSGAFFHNAVMDTITNTPVLVDGQPRNLFIWVNAKQAQTPYDSVNGYDSNQITILYDYDTQQWVTPVNDIVLSLKETTIIEDINGRRTQTITTAREMVKGITLPNGAIVADPATGDYLFGIDPATGQPYLTGDIWGLINFKYHKPQAPRIRGLKYIVQENPDDAPHMYVYDGYRWQPVGAVTTIPAYSSTQRYSKGDVVEGDLLTRYRDTGVQIQTWGIHKYDTRTSGNNRMWYRIMPQCLADASDPANVKLADAANPITIPPRGYCYIDGRALPGGFSLLPYQGIYQNISATSLSIHTDALTGFPFDDLFDHEQEFVRITGLGISYTTSAGVLRTIQGVNDTHDWLSGHIYNLNDRLTVTTDVWRTPPDDPTTDGPGFYPEGYDNLTTDRDPYPIGTTGDNWPKGYRFLYSALARNVTGDYFDPNEEILEWVCLADLHSSFEYNRPFPDRGRLNSYIHIGPIASWPPEEYYNGITPDPDHKGDGSGIWSEPNNMARIDTIYIDSATMEQFVYRFDTKKGRNAYVPLSAGSGGRHAVIRIADPFVNGLPAEFPYADSKNYIHWDSGRLNDPRYPNYADGIYPVYISDPNVGDEIMVMSNPSWWDNQPVITLNGLPSDFDKLKRGDFVTIRHFIGSVQRDDEIFCSISDDTYIDQTDINGRQFFKAVVISTKPLNAELWFDLSAYGQSGKNMYLNLLRKPLGSTVNLPQVLAYREASFINAHLRWDDDNEFDIVAKVDKHTYDMPTGTIDDPADPTRVTIIDRFNDALNFKSKILNIVAQASNAVKGTMDFLIAKNPITGLVTQFRANFNPSEELLPGEYKLEDPSGGVAITDLRLPGSTYHGSFARSNGSTNELIANLGDFNLVFANNGTATIELTSSPMPMQAQLDNPTNNIIGTPVVDGVTTPSPARGDAKPSELPPIALRGQKALKISGTNFDEVNGKVTIKATFTNPNTGKTGTITDVILFNNGVATQSAENMENGWTVRVATPNRIRYVAPSLFEKDERLKIKFIADSDNPFVYYVRFSDMIQPHLTSVSFAADLANNDVWAIETVQDVPEEVI